jgi:uncharacterized protein (DUF4415 family)
MLLACCSPPPAIAAACRETQPGALISATKIPSRGHSGWVKAFSPSLRIFGSPKIKRRLGVDSDPDHLKTALREIGWGAYNICMFYGRQRRYVSKPARLLKTRIGIRLDPPIINFFRYESARTGGKVRYQSLINHVLRQYIADRTSDADAPQ